MRDEDKQILEKKLGPKKVNQTFRFAPETYEDIEAIGSFYSVGPTKAVELAVADKASRVRAYAAVEREAKKLGYDMTDPLFHYLRFRDSTTVLLAGLGDPRGLAHLRELLKAWPDEQTRYFNQVT